MIKQPRILVPNYKLGIELSHYLKESNKSIFVENKLLEYEKGKKINYLIQEDHKLKQINFETVKEFSQKKIEKTDNIKKIREISRNYKYIAVDSDLQSIFQDEFGYIECEKYHESKEGKRWFQIYNLKPEMCELEKLKSLEIFRKKKEYTDEFFHYIETKHMKESLKNSYLSFFNEDPIFIPQALDSLFYEAIYVNIVEKERMIIDKLLIKYISEDVLYVGKEAFIGAKDQIIYAPKFQQYPEFQKLDIKIPSQGYYQEKEIARENFSKVYAKQKGLYTNDSNFYANYKKYLKNLLYTVCVKKEKIDFDDKFKIDSEFYKLLLKTKSIIRNFELFLSKKQLKNIKKDVFLNQIRWDFCSLDTPIVFEIAISKTNFKEYYYKKKYCLYEYWIIAEDLFFNIEQDTQLDFNKKNNSIIEDDLFMWDDVRFIV